MPFPRQQTQIVGNLGKDPEMRYTPSGQAVTSFSVAVSREYEAQEGVKSKETTWFRVTAWGKLAEQVNPILKKGLQVLVIGRITPDKTTGGPRIWTKQDGTAGSSFELTANEVWLSIYRGGESSEPQYVNDSQLPPEDDIPF